MHPKQPLAEALKVEVITLPRQRPDCIWRRWSRFQHHANASKAAACATVNHHQNTPQNQTKTQRHTTHENCLTLLSEALKEEVITLPRQRPDCIWRRWSRFQHHANASKAAACATVNHHQNTPQNQTKTQRHTTHENCLTLLSEALKEEVITLPRQRPDCIWRRWSRFQHHANASKAAACATVNHHQNTPQNQTKTQRHTTHENCLTLLSEALKEEVTTLPRQRPDCIWRRWSRFQHHANASKAAACATVNHHQNTPQNQTKTQRHTTPRKLPNVAF